MGHHLRQLLFIVILFAPILGFSQGQELGLRLSAKNTSYESGLVSLEGNVEIAIGDQIFKADKAIVNRKNGTIKAEGNVVLVSDDTVIEGSSIDYNYKTRLGTIKNGFVQNGPVVFEGEHVEKTGENKYLAKDAKFTSCINCPSTWSFSGREIDAEIGGYAYIKYPVLRILDFPIFILPRLLLPLKSDRQSGLLVPVINFSDRGGAAITQSYFWAISRSEDMTFSAKKFERRGAKGIIEHRKVLDDNSQSYLNAGYMRDEAYTTDGQDTDSLFQFERAFFVYKQYHQLPEGFIHRVNLNYLSDLRYVRDFPEDLVGHKDPSLENSTSITQNTENTHLSAEVTFHLNLLQNENGALDKGDAFSRNDAAVHKWPEIRYALAESEIGTSNVFFNFDANYAHFSRRDQSFDDNPSLTADNQFNPNTDFVRTGHRLLLTPEVSYPMRFANAFNITPRLKYEEAQYRFTPTPSSSFDNYEKNASRRYVQTDIELGTVFSRIYDTGKKTRLKHEILPEIIYSEIPWAERPDHSFFGNFEDLAYSQNSQGLNQDDLSLTENNGSKPGLQFDYRDRLFDKKLVTFQFTNNFVKKTLRNKKGEYKKVALHRIRQSYDMNEAKRDNPEPWSEIYSLLDLRFKNFETLTVTEYYPYADVTNWKASMNFRSAKGSYLQLNYTYNQFFDDNNNPSDILNESLGVGLGFKSKYFDFIGLTNYSLITEELEGWKYLASIKLPGECLNIQIGQEKTEGADTNFELNLNFDFGGT